ncbi:helix-turn-helix domain-containing protein [Bdellovibrio bacteriovorus]|uniref:Transcriptional regulator n=1 Tax=Bdellovibrio bacteriovorus TaxID=959 RepID=A0A1Z3N6E3_BDEBC|nr:helix-turn-helix transcriptional regulator [Bdellovibrio bacteriovorus]ASD63026.1 transcriptional regulator [Bdellovibrio bacteriovorus]
MALKKNTLGQFLKEKRTLSGLSQGEVSKKLGYSTPQFISNWARGVSSSPIDTLKKIGQIYHVSADELFERVLEGTIESVRDDMAKKFKKG